MSWEWEMAKLAKMEAARNAELNSFTKREKPKNFDSLLNQLEQEILTHKFDTNEASRRAIGLGIHKIAEKASSRVGKEPRNEPFNSVNTDPISKDTTGNVP
jgi:hypothetical protein